MKLDADDYIENLASVGFESLLLSHQIDNQRGIQLNDSLRDTLPTFLSFFDAMDRMLIDTYKKEKILVEFERTVSQSPLQALLNLDSHEQSYSLIVLNPKFVEQFASRLRNLSPWIIQDIGLAQILKSVPYGDQHWESLARTCIYQFDQLAQCFLNENTDPDSSTFVCTSSEPHDWNLVATSWNVEKETYAKFIFISGMIYTRIIDGYLQSSNTKHKRDTKLVNKQYELLAVMICLFKQKHKKAH